MSRVLKRPMFRMGGPADGGITSGLNRQGYHAGGTDRPRTTPQEILQGYGPAPRGYNVYDFLTEWGLNMVGNPPSGNVIQTAGKEAQIPFGKMMEGKGRASQLDYAMRAQASDASRAHNLALEKMDLQKYLGELTADKKDRKYSLMKPRPLYELEIADKIKFNKNEMDQLYTDGQSKWKASVFFDKESHAKGNVFNAADTGLLIKNTDKKTVDTVPYVIDLTKFKEGDQYNIYWDSVDKEWFTVNLNEETQKWDLDKTKSMSIGSETEDFKDSSLIEMQNFIENKREVDENERLLDIKESTNLPEVVTEEIKLKEITSVEIIHPTSDGTAKGTISDEYLQDYAEKNKIVFNMDDFKKKGGGHAGYKLMTKTQLRNILRRHNIQQTNAIKNEKKKEKSRKRKAFIWFNMNLEKFEAGILTEMPGIYKSYLDEYKKLDKKEILKIVRNE